MRLVPAFCPILRLGDLKMGDGLRLPTLLNKGYLLDNKVNRS